MPGNDQIRDGDPEPFLEAVRPVKRSDLLEIPMNAYGVCSPADAK